MVLYLGDYAMLQIGAYVLVIGPSGTLCTSGTCCEKREVNPSSPINYRRNYNLLPSSNVCTQSRCPPAHLSLPLKPHPKADILLQLLHLPPSPSAAALLRMTQRGMLLRPRRQTWSHCSNVSRTSGTLSKYDLDCSSALSHPPLAAGSTVLRTADALDLVMSLAYERASMDVSREYLLHLQQQHHQYLLREKGRYIPASQLLVSSLCLPASCLGCSYPTTNLLLHSVVPLQHRLHKVPFPSVSSAFSDRPSPWMTSIAACASTFMGPPFFFMMPWISSYALVVIGSAP